MYACIHIQSERKMHGATSRAESDTTKKEEYVTRCSYEHESTCHMVSELGFPAY
jgi:hypothetical protein